MLSLEAGFYDDVMAVEKQLWEKIVFKNTTYKELIDLPMDELDRHGCPAIVLGINRAFRKADEKAVSLAVILQFIFIADRVHALVYDEQEEESQYPVLVGDFLFGMFFLELTKKRLDHFLKPLAETIAVMSEGGVARWLAEKDTGIKGMDRDKFLAILAQERASLTGVAARLSAELAKSPQYIKDALETFGHYLGMAWAAYNERLEKNVVSGFLKHSKLVLDNLEQNDTIELKPLYELYQLYSKVLLPCK